MYMKSVRICSALSGRHISSPAFGAVAVGPMQMVFLTGDTLSPTVQAFLEDAGVSRLTKPFNAAMVRQVIQSL